MFSAQAARLIDALAAMPADAAALAHTLKGSARAIGAFAVAEAAARLEAVIASGSTRPRRSRSSARRCAGAGRDRGGPAPFLSGPPSIPAELPEKCRRKVFVPTAGAARIDPL